MGSSTALVVGLGGVALFGVGYYAIPEFKAGVDEAWANFMAWIEGTPVDDDPEDLKGEEEFNKTPGTETKQSYPIGRPFQIQKNGQLVFCFRNKKCGGGLVTVCANNNKTTAAQVRDQWLNAYKCKSGSSGSKSDPCAGFNISTQCVAKTHPNYIIFKNGNGCWRNKACNGKIAQLCLTAKNIGNVNTQAGLNKLAAAWAKVHGCKKASMARTFVAYRKGSMHT